MVVSRGVALIDENGGQADLCSRDAIERCKIAKRHVAVRVSKEAHHGRCEYGQLTAVRWIAAAIAHSIDHGQHVTKRIEELDLVN